MQNGALSELENRLFKAGDAITLKVTLIAGVHNNASATELICNSLRSINDLERFELDFTHAASARWVMPDCVYEITTISMLRAGCMILNGNTTFPDPLQRLGKSLTNLAFLELQVGSLHYASGSAYTADWDLVFSSLPSVQSLTLSEMGLFGSLPNTLPRNVERFIVSGNHLSGTFPQKLFSSLPRTLTHLSFSASDNPITGTFPDPFFGKASLPVAAFIWISVANLSVTGNMPSVYPSYAPYVRLFHWYANQNTGLTGTISPALISSIKAATPEKLVGQFMHIHCINCSLTGKLDLPEATDIHPALHLSFPGNQLSGITFGTNSAAYLETLDVSRNPHMTGDISRLFASNTSQLESLFASHTALSGVMPVISESTVRITLHKLDLEQTNIQFCDAPENAPTPLNLQCNLRNTTAYYCSSLYPNCDTEGMPPPALAPGQPIFVPPPVVHNNPEDKPVDPPESYYPSRSGLPKRKRWLIALVLVACGLVAIAIVLALTSTKKVFHWIRPTCTASARIQSSVQYQQLQTIE